mgnify:CR=1 FL=1
MRVQCQRSSHAAAQGVVQHKAQGAELGQFKALDLASHEVAVSCNGAIVATGRGANALGDPSIALAWLATELVRHGYRLEAGDLVITGTCVVPVPVVEGQEVVVDFGALGTVSATTA